MSFSKIGILYFAFMLLTVLKVSGQDHLYTQFFNSPVYLNPALNGQFQGDFRANLIYRNQYSTSGSIDNYFTAEMDYNIPKFGGGVGIMFNRSSEGAEFLNTNNIAGIYSYSVGSDTYTLSFGLQAGISNQNIDYSKLVFDDQLDSQIGIIPGSTSAADALPFNNRYYFDSGLGLNLVVGNFMIGGAAQHLNKPNDSFTGVPVKLPIRSTAYMTYRLDLDADENMDDDDKSYLIPSVVFYKQAQSQSVSAGVEYKHRNISAGIWYRSGGQAGPSVIAISLIFDIFVNKDSGEKFRLGVSHDAQVSGLNYGNTSGSSEGSINYQTVNPNRATDDYHNYEGQTHCYDFY
jgi:type IX secretion system PorP/SprF family membrane protein